MRGRGRRTKLIGVCVCVRGGIRAKKLGGMGGGGLYFYRGDPLQGVSRSGHFCWSRCVRHYEYGLVSGGGDGFQGVRLHDYPRSEYAENMSSKRSWARNQFSRSNREFVQGQVCLSGTIVNHFQRLFDHVARFSQSQIPRCSALRLPQVFDITIAGVPRASKFF